MTDSHIQLFSDLKAFNYLFAMLISCKLLLKFCILCILAQQTRSYINVHPPVSRKLTFSTIHHTPGILSRQMNIQTAHLTIDNEKRSLNVQNWIASKFQQTKRALKTMKSSIQEIQKKVKTQQKFGSLALAAIGFLFWSIPKVLAKATSVEPMKAAAAAAAGLAATATAAPSQVAVTEVQTSFQKLIASFHGVKFDSLLMLIATSIVIPLFKRLKYSPIIGFLLMGTILGPNGFSLVRDVHMIDVLGELGIIFFLFEMGLELSLERLNAMKKDVFGLGTLQLLLTSLLGTLLSLTFFKLSLPASFTIGASIALSSSAFVLQLLKDSNAMGSRHGKASFGILLLQDLAVVPLLIIVQLLSEGGSGIQRALLIAATKAIVTLSTMSVLGKKFLDPIFSQVAKSKSHEAFLSIILATVLLMSFLTEGIGLSHSLGAFLAGLLLSETRYRYQIEADIAPFRGLLLGIFFMTVGFSIDIKLLFREGGMILSLLTLLISMKASIIFLLSLLFGVPLGSAIITGLLNSQGGEFAFVSLGIAQNMKLIPELLSKKLLTAVALSMAITPMLSDIGNLLAKKIEQKLDYKQFSPTKALAKERKQQVKEEEGQEEGEHVSHEYQKDFIVICGHGRIGKLICQLLDRKFMKYLIFDNNPQVALDGKKKGLPVYYGDVNRPEMLKHFNVGNAKVCIITFDEISMINKAVVRLRKSYPNLPILVRAKNEQHRQRLENMFG